MRVVIASGLFASTVVPVYAELPVHAGLLPVPGGVYSNGSAPAWTEAGNADHHIEQDLSHNKDPRYDKMIIDQHRPKVILNWDSFNVGKENTVQFKQPDASSVALNRIYQGDPSQILGHITANGQIYLVNNNGFVFGKDSVVDANTLVASALNISDDTFKKGIIRVFDDNRGLKNVDQAAFKGQTLVNRSAAISFEKGLKTDIGGFLIDKNNQSVLDQLGHKIHVEPNFTTNAQGQLIGAKGQVVLDNHGNPILPVSVKAHIHTDKNGNIIIVAPTIENSGSLSTDTQGQIIMAASEDKVYLQPNSNSDPKKDPFSGLLVEVGKGGIVTNKETGEISVRQGNVTLAGFAVNQEGRISATTSVSVNGSIRLLARENPDSLPESDPKGPKSDQFDLEPTSLTKTVRDNEPAAKVRFGAKSSTTVLADADGGSALDGEEQKQSLIEVTANKIHMQSGSSVVATNGNVDFKATDNVLDPLLGTQGRIILEKGSSIDVSGTKNVKVAMERNVAEISVQSINLRDAPYQRGGVLQGQKVNVDIRTLPTIVDASSGSTGIKRGIDERLAIGEAQGKDADGNLLGHNGKINLTSSGDVVVNNGAVVDISGGSVSYQDGYINTTKLQSVTGRVVDIENADPNERYASIFGVVTELHTKWGVGTTATWNLIGSANTGRFEKGYTEGKAGGALNIQSPVTAWGGQVIAGSVSSIYQRNQPVSGGAFTLTQVINPNGTRSEQDVVFQKEQQSVNVGIDYVFPTNPDNQTSNLVFSKAFVSQSGISNLTVKTFDNVTVEKDAALTMPVLSKFNVDASNINIKSSIYTAGGAITLNGKSDGLHDTGNITLDKDSVLDVSGRWVNDFKNDLTSPTVIDAGAVSLNANKVLDINKGALIKADGGAWLNSNGTKWTAGKAGNIDLIAGTAGTDAIDAITGSMNLKEGSLSAYGLSQGGSLTISTNKINVGASAELNALNLGVNKEGELNIVANAGFSKISLNSNLENTTVKKDTHLSLMTQNRVLGPDYLNQASSSSIAGFSQVMTLPENLRTPVTLSLSGQKGVKLEANSEIRVDKGSTVNVTSENLGKGIDIEGVIDAQAGNINLILDMQKGRSNLLNGDGSQAIWLGAHSRLNVQGTTLLNPADALGNITGSVLNGGKVTIKADRGYVVVEKGAVINVSGTSANLDLPTSNSGGLGLHTTRQVIGSDAGKISIAAAEGIVLDGALNAKAGSATNRGGSLDLTLDRNQRKESFGDSTFRTDNALTFNVLQDSQLKLPVNTMFDSNFGSKLNSINGQATVSSKQISVAGIEQLRLAVPLQIDLNDGNKPRVNGEGVIQFSGKVDLKTASSIVLDAEVIRSGVNGQSQGAVNLDTGYLQLGSSTYNKVAGASVLGGGTLTTQAKWTQLDGALLMTGFKEVNLNSDHDLRTVGVLSNEPLPVNSGSQDSVANLAVNRVLTGSLKTAANLNLKASQIYPTTLTQYTFAVTNPSGKLTVAGSNTDTTPLSAAGKLTLNAHTINQNGVLKAPLGTIEFNTDLSNQAAANLSGSLNFGKDSVTSVSTDGQTIPFGAIVNNMWEYSLTKDITLIFNKSLINQDTKQYEYLALGEKHLVFKSPDIEFKKGSIVDVSGGGDLQASQFQTGAGGSYDYLQPGSKSYQGGFAILPTLGSSLAPFDPNRSAGFGYDPRSTIHLAGSGALPTGDYVMLPAYYALLPGAYLVTPQAKTQDQILTSFTKSGLPIVSGYQTVAGTDVRDSRTSGYLIETSADVKKHSTYDIQSADSFFAKQAVISHTAVPLLPQDSGQISIDASTRLVLDGQFKVAAPKGRGAKMDISAKNIQVVNKLTANTGALQLLDKDLSLLHVDSLLLGGTRSFDNATGNIKLDVSADNVIFDKGAKVEALDLVASGKNSVEVKNGASINSSGEVNTGDTVINVTGDSALLRVSADKQITISRSSSPSSGLTGDLLIDQGAVLKASKSMLLDASKSTVLDGDIVMHGGALTMAANAINLGNVGGLTGNALNLSNQKLLSLSVDDMVLNSRHSINFYGDVGQLDSSNHLAPIQFKNLVLDAAALSGFGAGAKAKLQANTIVLQNTQGVSAAQSGTGDGTLDLIVAKDKEGNFGDYIQGSGAVGLNGFKTVNINADKQFIATGTEKSVINAVADLNITASSITTNGGHSLEINAGDGIGHKVVISGNSSTVKAVSSDFGGRISVAANEITLQDANVLLPSGNLALESKAGDIQVKGKTDINLAGKAVNFADTLAYTPGGTFSATANLGTIVLEKDSNLDISTGGGSAPGGNLILKAPEHSVQLEGKIKATGGSAILDVKEFNKKIPGQDFNGLMSKLNAAGVTNALYVRNRSENITQVAGNVLTAKDLSLVADIGAIDIFGTLNANGSKEGGTVNLYAGDKITLESGALISAKGTDKGGKVSLSSIDSLEPDHSGIEIKKDSSIDVSGMVGGEVTLSALRNGNDVNIAPVLGTVKGYSKFYAEGVKKYTNADLSTPNSGEINTTDFDKINAETAAYMAAAAQDVDNRLGGGIHLRPGVEIDYNGDLTLAGAWDLSTQRFGLNSDIPGTLTIRTDKAMNVNNSLTDGFTDGKLQEGDSWSFNVVSGADLTSADKVATIDLTRKEKDENNMGKDLVIGTGASIHTGSGDIKLASGGNIVLKDQTSTVYNAGRADSENRYGSLVGKRSPAGEYPTNGGNLSIRAGGNITGAVSNQFFSSQEPGVGTWLTRQGNLKNSRPSLSAITAWAVNASQFQQNIGSFGGGKVDIAAMENINDLSVMMPTTGKQLGSDFTNFANNDVQIQGGGQMKVSAGGDISGGAYFLGKGEGVITAGGQIKGSSSSDSNAFTKGPQIVMSGDQKPVVMEGKIIDQNPDSNLALNAGSGIKIAAVSDAMVLNAVGAGSGAEFFTYSDKSKLALKSLAGDIHLNSNTDIITTLLNITNPSEKQFTTIYPASVDATAFGGSVNLDGDIVLFPSAVSNLNVLAKQDITSVVGLNSIMMLDLDPTLLPNVNLTIATDSDPKLLATAKAFSTLNISHALTPIHSLDQHPQLARVVTKTGDISSVQVILPKPGIIQAGRDLINSPIQIQNINQDDVSIISAGRDIFFATDFDINGVPPKSNDKVEQIAISGPGNALVKTGRNLDLGSALGLITDGNASNPALPITGASLDVLVGLHEGTPSYNAFIDKYLQTNPLYTNELTQVTSLITKFMQERSGDITLSKTAAMKAFATLPGDQILPIQPQLNSILSGVFFNELKLAGSASAANKSAGNQGGFAAIDTLFPGNQWQGDLTVFFSKLQTINGGDINLLVPGGQINAGLAVAPSGTNAKTAGDLGIVAQRQGNINAYVKNDFIVNTSRVFTLGGGDILIWSSEGNIDAGKGAKSALAVTIDPPYYDANDKLVYPPSKITSGSGIRTAGNADVPAGNVFLFAPQGVVDAGEAGIGGSNVTISATAVLGANNIQVSGTSTGVPVASVGSLAAGLTGTSNVTANATQTAQAAMGDEDKEKAGNKNMTLGMLSVELLGFGE
jgi:filamentous hemagglutinin family protein